MGNYATSIVYHIILAVLDEENFFSPRERRRMTAFVFRRSCREGARPVAVMCGKDHLHLLVQGSATVSVRNFVRRAKAATSRWMNRRRGLGRPFFWQREYLAFTVAPIAVARARAYVHAQDAIHAHRSFREECAWILGEGTGGNQAPAPQASSTTAAAVPVLEPAAPLA